MTDPMRMGAEAAAEVVERLLEFGRTGRLRAGPLGAGAAGGAAGGAAAGGAATGEQRLRRLQADADRIIELSADMARAMVDAAVGMASGSGSAEQLAVGPLAAGEAGSATAWLHLLDGPPAGRAGLFASALTSSTGAVVAGEAVAFEPAEVDTTRLRTSVEIVVRVTVPADARAGTYYGHVLATGLPEVGLPLLLEVTPS